MLQVSCFHTIRASISTIFNFRAPISWFSPFVHSFFRRFSAFSTNFKLHHARNWKFRAEMYHLFLDFNSKRGSVSTNFNFRAFLGFHTLSHYKPICWVISTNSTLENSTRSAFSAFMNYSQPFLHFSLNFSENMDTYQPNLHFPWFPWVYQHFNQNSLDPSSARFSVGEHQIVRLPVQNQRRPERGPFTRIFLARKQRAGTFWWQRTQNRVQFCVRFSALCARG